MDLRAETARSTWGLRVQIRVFCRLGLPAICMLARGCRDGGAGRGPRLRIPIKPGDSFRSRPQIWISPVPQRSPLGADVQPSVERAPHRESLAKPVLFFPLPGFLLRVFLRASEAGFEAEPMPKASAEPLPLRPLIIFESRVPCACGG